MSRFIIILAFLGLALVGPLPAYAGECTSSDLQIEGPIGNFPPDIWEQRAHPETSGKYVDPKEQIGFKFNENISADLFKANVTVAGCIPRRDHYYQQPACDSATVLDPSKDCESQGLVTHTVAFSKIRNYLGLKEYIIMTHVGVKDQPDDPFVFNCKYTLTIQKGPLTDDGKCLANDIVYPFQVVPDPRTPFEREAIDVNYDLPTGEIRSFRIKPDVTVRPDEIVRRYQSAFGWGINEYDSNKNLIVQVGEPQDVPGSPGIQTVQFRQQYKGIPVEGGGFVVQTKDGFVQSVIGRYVPGLNLSVTPTVSESTALDAAKTAIGAQQYAWDWKPDQFSPPKGELIISNPKGDSDKPEDFRLTWRFKIAAHEPLLREMVMVDASDPAAAIQRISLIRHVIQPEMDDLIPLPEIVLDKSEGLTLYDNLGTPPIPRTDFKVSMYTIDGTSVYVLTDPIGPPKITTLYLPIANLGQPGVLWPIYDLENTFLGAAGDPTAQKEGVSVYWALHRAVEYVNRFFGRDPVGSSPLFPSDLPLLAIVAGGQWDLWGSPSSPASTVFCYDVFDLLPKEIGSKLCMIFELYPPDNLKPAVSPDIVGHELYHVLKDHVDPDRSGGLVEEGLADVFGTLLKFYIRGEGGTWKFGEDITPTGLALRDLAAPENSSLPSTYGDENWMRIDQACRGSLNPGCGIQDKSTVIGRAFYLMAQGGSGTNSLGCNYSVDPLDSVNGIAGAESRIKAGDILWKTTGMIFPTFVEKSLSLLRDFTYYAALDLYGYGDGSSLPPQVKTVTDAWNAVGVGNPSSSKMPLTPKEGAKGVEPWPTGFDMILPNVSQTWQIRISSSLDFKCHCEPTDLACLRSEPDCSPKEKEFTWTSNTSLPPEATVEAIKAVSFYLKPATRYYWQYRIKPTDPALDWSKCDPIFFFTTASKAPQLINPEPPTTTQPLRAVGAPEAAPIETVNSLAYGEAIQWMPVEHATKYFYRISESPDDLCGPKDNDTWAGYITGTSFKPEDQKIYLTPEKTYYLYLKAIGGDMSDPNHPVDVEGECSNKGAGIAFKTPVYETQPVIISPQGPGQNYGGLWFKWSNDSAPKGYTLTISGPPEYSDQSGKFHVDHNESSTTQQFQVVGFRPGMQIHWTVEALASDPQKPGKKAEADFSTDEEPTTPVIISPIGVQDPGGLWFKWSNDSAPRGYSLTISGPPEYSDQSGTFHVDHNKASTTQQFQVTGFRPGMQIHWMVEALPSDPAAPRKTAEADFSTKVLCGNGMIDSGSGETCDDGTSNGQPDKCNTTCTGKMPPSPPPCTPPAAPITASPNSPGSTSSCDYIWGSNSNYFWWYGSPESTYYPAATHYRLVVTAGGQVVVDQTYSASSVCSNNICVSPLITNFQNYVCYTWLVYAGTEGCGQITWSQPSYMLNFSPM